MTALVLIVLMMMVMKTHQYEYERGKTMLKFEKYFLPNK